MPIPSRKAQPAMAAGDPPEPMNGAVCTHIVLHCLCASEDLMNRNVTLRLDEAVLRKARHAAVELGGRQT